MEEGSLFSTPSSAFIACRLLDSSHSDWHDKVPHCGFDLHFSDNEWCWASFHVFVSHLYVFFGEFFIKIWHNNAHTHTHTHRCSFVFGHMWAISYGIWKKIYPLTNKSIPKEYLDEPRASSDNHLWLLRTKWSVNLLWKIAVSNENVKQTLTFCNQS